MMSQNYKTPDMPAPPKMSMKKPFGFQLREKHKMTSSKLHPQAQVVIKKCADYSIGMLWQWLVGILIVYGGMRVSCHYTQNLSTINCLQLTSSNEESSKRFGHSCIMSKWRCHKAWNCQQTQKACG